MAKAIYLKKKKKEKSLILACGSRGKGHRVGRLGRGKLRDHTFKPTDESESEQEMV